MSMPSASARRGTRWRSISASPTSCTSCPRSCSARPRRCWPCAATGPTENPDVLTRLIRAHGKAADFVEDVANREEVCRILSAPNRIGVAPEVIRRTLDGRLKVAPDGTFRSSDRYLLVGRKGAARPDPVQAAWLYAQMVRWGQAPMSHELLEGVARGVPPGSLRRRCSARRSGGLPASRPTASARSPARHSTPTTSPRTWRPGRSSARLLTVRGRRTVAGSRPSRRRAAGTDLRPIPDRFGASVHDRSASAASRRSVAKRPQCWRRVQRMARLARRCSSAFRWHAN